ncbi:MAG TPA: PatB family C-S lyase [Candidatus Eremiobacteraceae bacterium]|nr:PatB family C-S lyase [Candidatus Eremiobacteraceae bacterium]
MQTQSSDLRQRTSEKWRRYPSDVLPLFIAEMDFALAPAIAGALHDAVERSDTGYAWPYRLRTTFCEYTKRAFDWSPPEDHVFVVNDVAGGIIEALKALTAPGDGVAIMPPIYPPFFEIIGIAERRVVEVPLMERDSWQIDFEALEVALRRDAKAILLCHPHNPTGRVFSPADLTRIAALAGKHNAVVISDEIHAPLVYPEVTHTPFAIAADGVDIDSVTLMSASKGWNLAGLKCGQLVANNERVAAQLNEMPNDVRDRIGHFGVIATEAAYRSGLDWMAETLATLDRNRRLLGELLEERLPDVRYRMPEATFLAWLDFRRYHLGDDPAQVLLERGRVALAHGPEFGRQGHGFARLNFATSPAMIEDAVSRMAAAMA